MKEGVAEDAESSPSPDKRGQIASFVTSTCTLFDSYIEFSAEMTRKFAELKKVARVILASLDETRNSEETRTEPMDEVDSPPRSPSIIRKAETAADVAKRQLLAFIDSNPLEAEELTIRPQIDEQQSTLRLLAKLAESIEVPASSSSQCPFVISDTIEADDDDDEAPVEAADTVTTVAEIIEELQTSQRRKCVELKPCRVLLERLEPAVAKKHPLPPLLSPEAVEDLAIERLCRSELARPRNTAMKATTQKKRLVGKKPPAATAAVPSASSDDTDDDGQTLRQIQDEHLRALGLIPNPELAKLNKTISSSSLSSLDDDDDEDLKRRRRRRTTPKSKQSPAAANKLKTWMPELTMSLRSSSEDEAAAASGKTESTRQRTRSSLTAATSRRSTRAAQSAKGSDQAADTEPNDAVEIKEEKAENNHDDSDEDDILATSRRRKRNKVIHSNENSENEKKSSESSEEDEELQISTRKKKRVKYKKSDSEEENKSDGDEDSEEALKEFNRRKKKPRKPKRDSSSENSKDEAGSDDVVELDEHGDTPSKTRHKLRNIIDDGKLTKETQDALVAERERKRRIEEKRKLDSDAAAALVEVEKLYLDYDNDSKTPLIEIDRSIVRNLKPHQIEGIKFMWDSCFEKVEMIASDHAGGGCMLAHCMGLGKTLQVIALVHTLLTHVEHTRIKRVLILLPVNVLINWRQEFTKWTGECKKKIKLHEFSNERGERDLNRTRIAELERWFNGGGVFLMSYNIFTRLVQGSGIKPKKLVERFRSCLTKPGADMVICDEGHILKSDKTSLAKSVYQVETKRRIVLTGTPLQNNLIEYHCMVSFVKPNLLGTIKEFKNRFVNPINNGQHRDSTEADVRYMKKRAHVLHNALDGCVQRKDYAVIRKLLPPKTEYVLNIRLSEKQIELYRTYLVKQRGIENASNMGKIGGAQLFADFQLLSRVWTHPWLLKINEIRLKKLELRAAENDFIDDDDGEDSDESEVLSLHDDEEEDTVPVKKKMTVVDSDIECEDDEVKPTTSKKSMMLDDDEMFNDDDANAKTATDGLRKKYVTRNTRSAINGGGINKVASEDSNSVDSEPERPRWWTGMITDDCEFDIELSGKIAIFDKILTICQEKGDKLLLFSQSIMSLDYIEKYLNYLTSNGKGRWKKDLDYFRIDGQIDVKKRKSHIQNFNDLENKRSRLFIISTRAGGIGINLVGANRCIIFDASWNPSYDTQSIFRIYRFGQMKEVFVYRFLAQGTMEEKIYQRQVNKQSLSQRVIDEHQLDRHFTSQELSELYAFEPDVWKGTGDLPVMPHDDLLRNLLLDCRKWISKYHTHDSLLENKLDEGLSAEDRQSAWDEYEAERTNQRRFNNAGMGNPDIANFSADQLAGEQLAQLQLLQYQNAIAGMDYRNFISQTPNHRFNPAQFANNSTFLTNILNHSTGQSVNSAIDLTSSNDSPIITGMGRQILDTYQRIAAGNTAMPSRTPPLLSSLFNGKSPAHVTTSATTHHSTAPRVNNNNNRMQQSHNHRDDEMMTYHSIIDTIDKSVQPLHRDYLIDLLQNYHVANSVEDKRRALNEMKPVSPKVYEFFLNGSFKKYLQQEHARASARR